MRLAGKVALITGAGSGMGRAMAIRFAAEGAKVFGADWNEASLQGVTDEVRAAGGEMRGLKTNVAVRAEVEAMVAAAVEAYGQLDILVNNAGVMDINQGAAEMDEEVYRRVMGVNVDGPVFASGAGIRAMGDKGGVILNIASVAGVSGAAAGAAYTMSKHAVVGLTRNTAFLYGPKSIRCNAILAGAVVTNIMASVDAAKMDPYGSSRLQRYYGLIPAQLQPEDIASTALFLVSDEAKMISGALLAADGGWTAA
ncbi:MAG: SDR family oxidoreductase [Trueperaceae bacterium]|nr:SDR family oxidoreductase [Trueperaceae bacterium]HRQ11069.1 SDR family oxidoreductase [Trueperaceae bacterium]